MEIDIELHKIICLNNSMSIFNLQRLSFNVNSPSEI